MNIILEIKIARRMCILAFALLAMASLGFAATNFTIPSSQMTWQPSTLSNVAQITNQLWADITPTGTWHYYAVTKQGGGSLSNLPEITPNGFTKKDAKLIKASISTQNVTDYWNEMECTPQPDICTDETECSPQADTCVQTLNSRTYETTTFTEGSQWDVRLIGVKSDNWETGSFNPMIDACGELTDAGENYKLTRNITAAGASCIYFGAANQTLDCNGFSITGNNTTGTYGIYNEQNGTTIKNCRITGFPTSINASAPTLTMTGLIIDNVNATSATNNSYTLTISNANDPRVTNSQFNNTLALASATSGGVNFEGANGFFENVSSHSTSNPFRFSSNGLSANNITANVSISARYAITFVGVTNLTNCTVVKGSPYGINASAIGSVIRGCNINTTQVGIVTAAANLLITNNTITDASIGAVYLNAQSAASGQNTTVTNNIITSTGSQCLRFPAGRFSSNSTIANNTLNCSGIGINIAATNPLSNTSFINNTITSTGTGISLASTAFNNIFCWNNFTSSAIYVQDLNGSNAYNSTLCSGEGNIYANVMNGSIVINGSTASIGFPWLKVGITGSGFPYNNSTSAGKFVCSFAGCGDYAPLTPTSLSILTHYPFTIGVISNTSASSTSSTFSNILSLDFVSPTAGNSTIFISVKTDHSQSGGSSQVAGYRILVDGIVLGEVNSTNTNGNTTVRFFQSDSFIRNNATSVNITVQHARVSGTGTLITTFVDAVVFGMMDLESNVSNDYTQYNISNTSSSASFTQMFTTNLSQTYAAKVVILSSAQTTKTTTGEFQYYYNITYSNGTVFQCPTSKRYATDGTTASPPSACITPDNAPIGTTSITMYARDTAGSTAFTGKLHTFGYYSDELDCSGMTTMDGKTYNTNFLSAANLTINIDTAPTTNNHNIFTIMTAPTNGTAGLSSYALSFLNSTGEVPLGVLDPNVYINSRTLATTNGMLVAMRDWRNITGGNYTIHFNVSTATGTGAFSGGALMAFETIRVPSVPQSCNATFEWQSQMTPSGLIITRYTSAPTTWLVQFVEVTSSLPSCILNATAYGATGNGSVFGTVTSTGIGDLSLNHTNVPVNNSITLWSVLYLADGTNITLASRTYYIIASSSALGEDMIIGTLIGLSLCALLFGYLHANAKSYIWSNLWFFFACFMIIGDIMAVVVFAQQDGNTNLANIGMALFAGFFWVFLISMMIFLWTVVKDTLVEIGERIDGKKKD